MDPLTHDHFPEILFNLLARMYQRRKREEGTRRCKLTLCYAVSVRTRRCYVGYNADEGQFGRWGTEDVKRRCMRWQNATGRALDESYPDNICAEASALSIALSWGESVGDLVFLSMNNKGEPMAPCENCDYLLYGNARGAIKKRHEQWFLNLGRGKSMSQTDWENFKMAVGSGYPVEDVDFYVQSVGTQ